MIAQKNVTHMFISSDNALAAAVAVPAVARQLGVRRVGELLCDATALVAGDKFQIYYLNAEGKVITSPMFAYSDIVTKSRKAPAALVSQVSTIGYNGTDGDIVETNYGKYLITLGFKDILKQVGNKRLYKYGEYTAGASAKNYDIAIGLAGSLALNQSKDPFKRVIAKALCSYAVTAGDAFDANTVVVKGSQYMSHAANHNFSTGESLAVGDYIRLGSVGGGTALTSNVYRVIELTSATVLKVDRPVTDASGTYATATADAEVIRKANAELAATKWGLVLTGNDSEAPFEVGKYGPNIVMFSVGVSADFGATEVRLATTPSFGDGTYRQVATLDWELKNNHKEAYRIAEYPVTFTPDALSTDTYTYIYEITFLEKSTDSIGGPVGSYNTLMIVSQNGADANLATVFGL